jgi:hypothetical protein
VFFVRSIKKYNHTKGIGICTVCDSVADPDPASGAFLPPRSGMEQWSDPDPGSGISKQNLLIAFIQK